jgi:hypothetical protein
MPHIDKFVEVEVEWPEETAHETPVHLLAHQRQIQKLYKCRLQLIADLLMDMPA